MYIAMGELPPFIDPDQPPLRRNPWACINKEPFIREATLVLPDDLFHLLWDKLPTAVKSAPYAKVIMKLQDVLDGAFLDQDVKKGVSDPFLFTSEWSDREFNLSLCICFSYLSNVPVSLIH